MIVIKYFESSLMNKVHRAIIKLRFWSKLTYNYDETNSLGWLTNGSSGCFQREVSEKFLAMASGKT